MRIEVNSDGSGCGDKLADLRKVKCLNLRVQIHHVVETVQVDDQGVIAVACNIHG